MVRISTVVKSALALPGTEEKPHFDRRAFRTSKRIFATLSEKEHTLNLKLDPGEQSVYCSSFPEGVHPVAGGWGRMGWTTAKLHLIRQPLLLELLRTAHRHAWPASNKKR